MKSEFDNLLRQKIDEGTLPFDPLQWQRMSSMLDAKDKKKKKTILIPIFKSMAAGVAILIGIAGFIYYNSDKQTTATVKGPNEKIATLKTHNMDIIETTRTVPSPQKHHQPPFKLSHKQAAHDNVIVSAGKNYEHHEITLAEQIANSAKQTKSILASFSTGQHQHKTKKYASTQLTLTTAPLGFTIPEKNKQQPEPEQEKAKIQYMQNTGTILSLAGGLNYGNLNAGYSLGVNARKKLNQRIFLEGDIALVNNRSSFEHTYYTAYSPGEPSTANGNTSGAAPAIKTNKETIANSFYYIQFTPSVGYSLTHRINVSLGADMQQKVNSNTGLSAEAATNDGYTGTLPERDFGLTGKTEFAITDRIKTGILYRGGINNLVYEKTYLNRRYFQIQLKYQLFGK